MIPRLALSYIMIELIKLKMTALHKDIMKTDAFNTS